MPHRKNAKGDIGNAKKWSDTYDADNIYLSEEGWVYRHFKNVERTSWWDEILVAGQVKPEMTIHGVENGPGISQDGAGGTDGVVLTNPLKLGTLSDVPFQEGDTVFDYRYSDHASVNGTTGEIDTVEKVVVEKTSVYSATGHDQIAWKSINADAGDDTMYSFALTDMVEQTPDGWTGVSNPAMDTLYGAQGTDPQPPYPGDVSQSGAEYTGEPKDGEPVEVPPPITVGTFYVGGDTIGGGLADAVTADESEVVDDTIEAP